MTSTIAVTLAVSSLCAVPKAYASKNVYELDQEIVSEQLKKEELEDELAECQKKIDKLTAEVYKHSTPADTIAWILNSEDFTQLLQNIDYLNKVKSEYDKRAEELRSKLREIKEIEDGLEELRNEKAKRVKKLSEASSTHYAQADSRWANVSYYGGSMSWTGCGLCAYTSAVNILTGEDINPPEMLELRGDWVGMDHYTDSTVGTPDGSTHAEITDKLFDLTCYNCSTDDFLDEIADKNATAVVLVRGAVKEKDGGWWYTDGHYLCAFDYSDGVLHVHDPGRNAGSDVTYSGDEINSFLGTISSIVIYRN